jgi:hypothetical protein
LSIQKELTSSLLIRIYLSALNYWALMVTLGSA